MKRCRILPFGIMLFVFLLACSSEKERPYLVKINNHYISSREFKYRLMFNPYLLKINDERAAKKMLLSSLIAEKIIYLEAQRAGFSENSLSNRIEHHLKEAMIEQLRRDSVEKTITISGDELKAEFLESLKGRRIRFIAFNSREEALQVKHAVDAGDSFEKEVRQYMIRQGWADQQIPQKELTWGGADSGIREQIKTLSAGQVSEPLPAFNSYYLVKVLKVYKTGQPTKEEFERRRSALEDYLRRKKIKAKYRQFYFRSLQPYLGTLQRDKVSALVDELLKHSDVFSGQGKQVNSDKELSDQIYLSTDEVLTRAKQTKVVRFPNGDTWDFSDLMKELKYGPYGFKYQNKAAFKLSFMKNAQLAVELEALYRLAKKTGYANRPEVTEEAEMWKSYLQAAAYRFKFLQNVTAGIDTQQEKSTPGQLSPIQERRLEAVDSLLATALPTYKITINTHVYNEINVPKTDMLVMKKHFAHRLIAPLLQPYTGLPRWQQQVDLLLGHFGII